MKKIKTYPPLILALRVDDNFYGLTLIEKGNDESLYVKFPRKTPYSIKHIEEFKKIPTEITFTENTIKYENIFNPYISYHQSGKVHLNSYTADRKKEPLVMDKLCTNKPYLLEKYEFVPLCSILLPINILNYDILDLLRLPNFNYYEISDTPRIERKDGQKAPSIITIDREKLPSKAILYVEIFLHKDLDNNGYLEFSKNQKVNLLEQITINNSEGELSKTLLIKYIPMENENPKGEIVNIIFNKEKPIALSFL